MPAAAERPPAADARAATITPSVGTRLSNREIHDNVLRTADEELRRPARELGWSALEAGLTIGFSMLAAA